jgi:predicted dehydrogenase/NADPH:quinone reductase-like Zn-dependent oxidoreductase
VIPQVKNAVRRAIAAGLERSGYTGEMNEEAGAAVAAALGARRRSVAVRSSVAFAGHQLVWPSVGRARLVPTEVPAPAHGQVTIEVLASCVSPGTERAQYLRLPNARPILPFSPGYSAAGRVAVVGRGVSGLTIGDLVAVPRLQHTSVATIPAANAVAVSAGVPGSEAAFVYLAVIAGYGLLCGGLEAGDDVCVIGAGPIGAAAQRLAAARGARTTTVIARSAASEAVARRGRADRFVFAGASDEIAELGASIVVDATGAPDTLALAVAAVRTGGRIVLLGSPRGVTGALRLGTIRRRGIELVGAHISSSIRRGREDGVDVVHEQSAQFLCELAGGLVTVADLTGDPIAPMDCDDFYRSLAERARPAHFAWSELADADRFRRVRVWRAPRVGGRGLSYEGNQLPPSTDLRSRVEAELADPFRHASGHLRVGLLGCGDIGLANAAAVTRAPNTELTVCFDPNGALAEDVARKFGCAAASSSDELLAHSGLDAVLIAAPHHLHAPLAIAAAEAGLHVLVEKPLANDLTSAISIAEATKRAGVECTVCFPFRLEPGVLAARLLFEAGAIGEFAGCTVMYRADKPESYWLSGYSNRASSDWRRDRASAGGGVLVMNLPHYVDLIRYVAGGIEVDAVTAMEAPGGGEIDDAMTVAVRFSNGSVGTIAGDARSRGRVPTEFMIGGSAGTIVLEPRGYVFPGRSAAGLTGARWHALPETPAQDVRAIFVSRFATAVDRGERPEVGIDDALAVQAFLEAAYVSSRSGVSVRPADLFTAGAS